MADGKIELKLASEYAGEGEEAGDDDVAYISLPDHPGVVYGVVKKQLRLWDLIGAYEGADVYFDFDKENRLIGIEILA